jgi:FlaA1/EpsC-like NDP-sugar epimerase
MRLLRRFAAALMMILFDATGLAASFFLAYVLRLTLLMDAFPSLLVPLSFNSFTERYYLLAVYLLVFAYEGLYTRRLVLWEEMRRVIRGTFLATVLVTMALYVTRAYILSRSVVLVAMILSFGIVPLMRTLAKQLVIAMQLWSKPIIIIGQDRNARILRTELAKNWRLGYRVVAVVDPQQIPSHFSEITGPRRSCSRTPASTASRLPVLSAAGRPEATR